MNKKLLMLLPIAAMVLSGCVKYNGKSKDGGKSGKDSDTPGQVTPTPTSGEGGGNVPTPTSGGETTPSTPAPEPVHGEVTTFLVLGANGLYKGNKGQDYDDIFLENTIIYKANVGSALPSATDITSSVNGSVFSGWEAYNGTGATEKYSVVPAKDKSILYATFTGGDGQGGGSEGGGDVPVVPTIDDGMPKSGFGLMYIDRTYKIGELLEEKDAQERVQYKISNFTVKAGDMFQIYDFANKAGWVENLDGWSLGGKSEASTYWTNYLTKSNTYIAKVDFVADVYLKLKYEDNLVYFELKGEDPIPGEDVEVPTGYGFKFENGNDMIAASISELDSQGREQYKLSEKEFHAGEKFKLWNFGEGVGWVETIDSASFAFHPNTYLSTDENWYTVKVDFKADVYIKLKYEDNQVYFGLIGDPIVDPDEEGWPEQGYGIMIQGNASEGIEDKYIHAIHTDDYEGFSQYKISEQAFKQGDKFTFYNKHGEQIDKWVVDINPASLKGFTSNYLEKYSSYYKVLQDFSCDIYLKLKMNQDEIYFDLIGEVIPLPTPTGTPSPEPTPTSTPIVVDKSFGIVVFGDEPTYVAGADAGEYEGYAQHKVSNYSFTKGTEFAIYHAYDGKIDTWAANIQGESFGGDVATYVSKTETRYVAVNDFSADIYVKTKYTGDLVYFELTSEPLPPVTPSPVDPSSVFTVYLKDNIGWATGNTYFSLDNTKWVQAEHTTGSETAKGAYKYTFSAEDSTKFYCYFTNNQNQYRHPTSGSVDYDTNHSEINLMNMLLVAGKEYVLTVTGEHYRYDNWEHAWFNYTFAELEVSPTPTPSVTPSVTPTSTEEQEYFTVYIKDEINWTNNGTLHVSIDKIGWDSPVATSGAEAEIGQWKITFEVASSDELYFWFSNDQGQDRHPNNAEEGCSWNTEDSTINIDETTLTEGHAYVITITSEADHWTGDQAWVHAWFNYTFAELLAG